MLKLIENFITNNTLFIFLFFIIFTGVLGKIYASGLHPKDKKIRNIINKFTVNDYSISYYAAERYLSWINMRTFFVMLNYLLTLIGIVASLMTVFYASTSVGDNNQIIVFLSLLSMYFTIGNLFINPCSLANMSQHSWRELEICIEKTIYKDNISPNEKDTIIHDKIAEIERYIETFER